LADFKYDEDYISELSTSAMKSYASNYDKVQKEELKREVEKKNEYEPHVKTEKKG
jgi:hypothetical protein